MRKYLCEITRQNGSFQLHCVNERKGVRYFFEHTAHKLEVKPNTGHPSRKVCKQSATNSAYLLVGKDTSEKQAKGYEKKRYGDDEKNGEYDIESKVKPQNYSDDIAYNTLRYCNRQDRQSVAEYKINGGKGCCIESLKQRATSIL